MSPTLRVQQVEFARGDERMLAWVDVAWRLKVGDVVIGKDKVEWTVLTVYDTELEHHHLNKKWEVGGL